MLSDVWTYQDAVEHLLDVFDSPREGRPLRISRRAVGEAHRTLATAHNWSYYQASYVFATSAPVSSGTIAYDHTGGTSERLMTLSGSTFPSWTEYGRIIVAGVWYPIDRLVDTTHVTLRADNNPAADLTAGTSYQLVRDAYALPAGCRTVDAVWNLTLDEEVDLLFPDQSSWDSVADPLSPDDTCQAYVAHDERSLNRLSLIFMPPPASAHWYRVSYQRSPRQLLTEKYCVGTVSVAAGSTTCTITTGTFSQTHVGAVIRFGTAGTEPEGMFGGLSDTGQQFSYQRLIVAVAADGATCTLDESLPAALTSVRFTVSDPLDVEQTGMLTALQRLAESAFTVLTKREQKDRLERRRLADMAVLEAKEQDTRIAQITRYRSVRDVVGDVDVMGNT